MTKSYYQGWEVEFIGFEWVFSDSKQSLKDTYHLRNCKHCDKRETKEGHDACLGTLPNVSSACCGHGIEDQAYVMLDNGIRIEGRDAIDKINELKSFSE